MRFLFSVDLANHKIINKYVEHVSLIYVKANWSFILQMNHIVVKEI